MSEGKPADISTVSDNDILEIRKYKTDSIPEQGFTNYMSAPSLESAALVNVVVGLWKHADFREEIMSHLSEFLCDCASGYTVRQGRFLEISQNVSERLSLLPLPNLLKEKARSMVTPIGGEMVYWIREFERCQWHCNSKTEHIDPVCFTTRGTIDKAKTLELLLGKMELGDIFNKACEYCLDDRIANLWEQMPRETRENSFYTCDIFQGYDRHLVAYWVCFVKNELPKLMGMIEPNDLYNRNHSIYRNMFTLSVTKRKASAAKYFWYNLTDRERNNNVVEWTCLVIEKNRSQNVHNGEYSDIIFFLLSQMNDTEQQRQVLRKYGATVLRLLFLGWPWQKFLLPKIQSIWEYLESDVYTGVLSGILDDMEEGIIDEQMLRVYWCISPIPFRKHFIQHIGVPPALFIGDDGNIHDLHEYNIFILCNLLKIKDTELIKLVLSDADVEERKRIIFSAVECHILHQLLHYYINESLLEILIAECLVPECEIKKLKADKMLEHGDELCRRSINYDNWRAFEEMLDWGFDSQDQVDALKAKIVNRIKVGSFLEEIRSFKWSSFEGFINWCFKSDEEIDQFRLDISPYDKLQTFMRHVMDREFSIVFPEMFLYWVFSSEKEIVQFKKKLMFSEVGLDMLRELVRRYANYAKDSHFQFVKMISQWFHGFEKEELTEFKKKIEEDYSYLLIDQCQDGNLKPLLDWFIHGDEMGKQEEYWFKLDTIADDWVDTSGSITSVYDEIDDCNDASDDCTDTSYDCTDVSGYWTDTSDDCTIASDDCCSSNHSGSSKKSGDDVELLMGELTMDEYEDIDYNGDIITSLDEILATLDIVWKFCSLIWSQFVRKMSNFIFD